MSIELQGITKTFGDFTALHDVQCTIATGKLVALLGPSGSGKTTLLRIIAGLEVPERGSCAVRRRGCDASTCERPARGVCLSTLRAVSAS